MAMTALAPSVRRSREILVQKSSRAALELLPEISEGKQADRKFFATFVSCVGIGGVLILLFINTLLAQDAFKLTHLKLQAKMVSDEREAITRQIDEQSSPEAVANAAIALGMKPSETPTFLNIDTPAFGYAGINNG